MPEANTSAWNKENLCETANQMGQKLRAIVDNAGDEMSGAGDFLTKEIKEKPLQSSLIALGIGAVLGLILTR